MKSEVRRIGVVVWMGMRGSDDAKPSVGVLKVMAQLEEAEVADLTSEFKSPPISK